MFFRGGCAFFDVGDELYWGGGVVLVHSKITFSIARNVIMIGLLSKRGDVVTTSPRLAFIRMLKRD